MDVVNICVYIYRERERERESASISNSARPAAPGSQATQAAILQQPRQDAANLTTYLLIRATGICHRAAQAAELEPHFLDPLALFNHFTLGNDLGPNVNRAERVHC